MELDGLGRLQAEKLSLRLQTEPITAVYSSDLMRARQTAEAIATCRGIPVNLDPDLREMNFGEWEGLTYQEIKRDYKTLAEQWYSNPIDLRIPGGETFAELAERSFRSIQRIVAAHQGETILVVAHGGTTRAIICRILQIGIDKIWSFRQDNAALNIIEFYGTKSVICLLNDSRHLG